MVYSSVGGAERNSGVPHFESKWKIEEHIRAIALPHTILRPVAFIDNYNWMRPMILNGVFPGFGLRPDTTLQLIAADDIGAFAAIAFAHPESYLGTAREIAGDELTEPHIAEVFGRVIGRPVQHGRQPDNQWNTDPDAQREQQTMITWFDDHGYAADIEALRQLHPGLLTLETWARQNGWEHAEPVPMSGTQSNVETS